MCEQDTMNWGILTLKRCDEGEKKNKDDKAEKLAATEYYNTTDPHARKKGWGETMQRTISVNAARRHGGIALAPPRPTAPGCAQRHRGSCPRVHRAAARVSAFPYAHGSARDVTLSA
jgi:hypothetical protein